MNEPSYAEWRQQKAERTRERLFLATLEVIAERGLGGASMQRAAAAAGMTTGAIYAHFTGKDDLLRSVMEYYRQQMPLLDVPDAGSLRELVRGRMRVLLDMCDSGDEIVSVIFRLQERLSKVAEAEPEVMSVMSEWHESRVAHLAERIDQVTADSGEQLTVDARLLAEQVIAVGGTLIQLRAHDPRLVPPEVFIAAADALVKTALPRRRT